MIPTTPDAVYRDPKAAMNEMDDQLTKAHQACANKDRIISRQSRAITVISIGFPFLLYLAYWAGWFKPVYPQHPSIYTAATSILRMMRPDPPDPSVPCGRERSIEYVSTSDDMLPLLGNEVVYWRYYRCIVNRHFWVSYGSTVCAATCMPYSNGM